MDEYISPCEDCQRSCEIPCWKVEHGLLRPVVRGEWLKSEWGYPDRTLTCNVCGFEYDSTDYNHPKFQQKLLHYCPNCGAMMGGNNNA